MVHMLVVTLVHRALAMAPMPLTLWRPYRVILALCASLLGRRSCVAERRSRVTERRSGVLVDWADWVLADPAARATLAPTPSASAVTMAAKNEMREAREILGIPPHRELLHWPRPAAPQSGRLYESPPSA